jgi:iron complex outermembrane receptor protein
LRGARRCVWATPWSTPGTGLRGAPLRRLAAASGQVAAAARHPRTVRTLVMIDGHPISNALSGGINVASLITDQIDRIEVVRGPYSALYGGNAMGGVINVITRLAGPAPLAQARAGIGNFGQRAGALALRHRLEGGLGITLATGWRESAGYADSDDVVKPTTAGTATVPVTGARATTTPDGSPAWWLGNKGARPWTQHYGDLGLHWNAGPATRITVGFAHTGYRVGYSGPDSFLRNSAGEAVYAGSVSVDGATGRRIALAATDWFTPTPASETDERFYARLNHRFADGSQLAAHLGMLSHRFTFSQASAGRATYDGGPGELTEQPNRRIDIDVSLRKRFSPQWAAVGGVAVSRGQLDRRTVTLVNWRDQDTKGNGLNSGSGVSESVAVFGQLDYRISDDLTAYAGGRADRVQHHGEVTQNTAPAFAIKYGNQANSQFSPKLALVWQASPSVSLRVYGQGFGRRPCSTCIRARRCRATATDSINDARPSSN